MNWKRIYEKIKKLFAITITSVLLFSCGLSQSSGENNAKGAAAAQAAFNKYTEFVLMYTQTCLKDFNVYGKDKAFWTQTDEYISIIINGTVKSTEKSIATAASKIGTYDEANKQITVMDGNVPVIYYLESIPEIVDPDANFGILPYCNL